MINFEIKYIIKTVPKRIKLYNLYVLNIFYTVTNRIIIDIKRYMYVCICMGAHRGGACRPQGGVGVWVPAWGGVTVWAPAGGWGVGGFERQQGGGGAWASSNSFVTES